MRKILVVAALMPFTASIAQRIDLAGVVVVQNSEYETGHKIYVSDASVRALYARPVVSDTKGNFSLAFAGVPSGSAVSVIARKQGMQTVNARELMNAVPARETLLEVVMVDSVRLTEAQFAYYQIAMDAITRTYWSRMEALRAENIRLTDRLTAFNTATGHEVKSLHEAIEKLTSERDAMEAEAEELARTFATANLDRASAVFREAHRKFTQGDVPGALTLLDARRLDDEYRIAHEQRVKGEHIMADANEAISQVYASYGLRAGVLRTTMELRAALDVLSIMGGILAADPDAFTPAQEVDLLMERGDLLHTLGRYADAEKCFRRAYDLDRTHYGADHIRLAVILDHWSEGLMITDRTDSAVLILQQGVDLLKDHEQDDPLLLADLWSDLAVAGSFASDLEAARTYNAKSLELRKAHLPPDHKDIITCYANMGTVEMKAGHFKEAIALMQEALHLWERSGRRPDHVLATIHVNMGHAYQSMNVLDSALTSYTKSRQVIEECMGKDHPIHHLTSQGIAVLYYAKGRYTEALAVADSGLASARIIMPADHSIIGQFQMCRGMALEKLDRDQESIVAYEESYRILVTAFGTDHPYPATCLANEAVPLRKVGDFSGALKNLRAAAEVYTRTLGPDHPNVSVMRCNEAGMLERMGQDSAAITLFRTYLDKINGKFSVTTEILGNYWMQEGRAYYRLGEADSSQACLLRSQALVPTEQNTWYLHRIANDAGRDAEALELVVRTATLQRGDGKITASRRSETLQALRSLAVKLDREDVLKEFERD